MRTVVSTKGQIALPAEFRRQDRIASGQRFEVERIDEGEYRLKRLPCGVNQGLTKLLLNCPAKGWFRQMDRHETTDDIEAPRLP